MDENRFEGTAKNIGGKVEGALGDLTGDQKLKADGMADKVSGTAQRTYGQAADAVRDTVSQAKDKVRDLHGSATDYGSQILDQVEDYGDALAEQVDARPITSVLIAAGVGFLIALLTKPSPKVVYRRR